MSKFIGVTRYQSYVIRDLKQDEAKLFWEEKLRRMKRQLIRHKKVVPPWPDFEIIFSMCGGNMFLIGKALDFWVIERSIKEVVDWRQFPFYTQELSKLTNAYFPSGLYKQEVGKLKPQWTGRVMLGVMKQLIATPKGVASYYDLCEEFVSTSVDSLIEHSIETISTLWL